MDNKGNNSNNFALKYSYRTRQGVQINNPNKTNQDSLLIKTQLNHQANTSMFAVADGHGLFGHCVSQYLVKNLSKMIEAETSQRGENPSEERRQPSFTETLPSAYSKLQRGLTGPNCEVNASCSGSTLINVII
jgi:serine/threonine protein phosphatase PrpC